MTKTYYLLHKKHFQNYHKRWYKQNRKRLSNKTKADRVNNPNRYFDKTLRSHYHITLAVYNMLLVMQNSCCAICQRSQSEFKRKFSVDHDHSCCPRQNRSCGKCIRGLLCGLCNSMLGYAHDKIDILNRGIVYLQEHFKDVEEEKKSLGI